MNTPDEDFDEFASAAWPRLRWAGYLISGDTHVGEDLAQAALVRTYARWSTVRRDDAYAYARRSLVNLNIDRWRRQGGMRQESERALDSLMVVSGADTIDDRDQLLRLLHGLTDRQRRVVVLRHYFDMAEAEVARELGITRGTVKSTLHRALAKLRVQVGETADSGDDSGDSVASSEDDVDTISRRLT